MVTFRTDLLIFKAALLMWALIELAVVVFGIVYLRAIKGFDPIRWVGTAV